MVLCVLEADQGGVNSSALEMLNAGRALAAQMEIPLEALAIGDSGRPFLGELGAYGVARIHLAVGPRLDAYAPEAWTSAMVQGIQKVDPRVVLAAGTDWGNEIMARVGARLDQPVVANCLELHPETPFRVKRVRWGGSLHEHATTDGHPLLLTIAPLTFSGDPGEQAPAPEIVPFTPTFSERDFRVQVTGRDEPEGGVSLADARVVVGGGRGVGSAEGFAVLEDLASLLGGAVGGSRVATNNGWRPHADQIGQTGTRIGPDLYIACGISGAIQHWVGCMGSKKILVINTDKEAPIIARSSYAVIGDLHEVIPAICVELKKRKGG